MRLKKVLTLRCLRYLKQQRDIYRMPLMKWTVRIQHVLILKPSLISETKWIRLNAVKDPKTLFIYTATNMVENALKVFRRNVKILRYSYLVCVWIWIKTKLFYQQIWNSLNDTNKNKLLMENFTFFFRNNIRQIYAKRQQQWGFQGINIHMATFMFCSNFQFNLYSQNQKKWYEKCFFLLYLYSHPHRTFISLLKNILYINIILLLSILFASQRLSVLILCFCFSSSSSTISSSSSYFSFSYDIVSVPNISLMFWIRGRHAF